MKFFIETEGLILRDLLPKDEAAFFEMDTNAEVQKYLGNKPSTSILQTREMIESIRQQFAYNGISWWAVIEKETANFIGWS